MAKISYRRILANSLEVFFVTMAGIATANALMNLNLRSENLIIASIIPALLQFGICFTHEWGKAEEEKQKVNNKASSSSNSARSNGIGLVKFNRLLSYLVI